MKVILLGELTGKGGEGDVIEVAQGYAENYLFPKGLALPASKGNLKQLEQRRHNIEKREIARNEDAKSLQEKLEGKSIIVRANVGEEGQLFGSITTSQIAEAIEEQLEVTIDKRKINTPGVIKTAGLHIIQVLIYREISAELTLQVIGLEDELPASQDAKEESKDSEEAQDETVVSEAE